MILTVRGDRIEDSLGGVSFCGVSQDVRDCLKNRLIRLCHVPGVGFANAVVAKIGIERELIFCMIAGESGAERRLVLTSLSRNIVGGGRQRRGRLIKLCGVPGGGFAVVAEIGIERELIFCMIAGGSGAERCRVLISLRRTIVGGGRQRRGRLVKLCGVPGGRFAVVAKMGIERELIFSRVADGSGAGRSRVLSSLGCDIVGDGRQRGRRLIKLCLVPSVGFANAVMARVGIFSMVTDESGAGRPRVLSGLRRTIVGGGRQRRGRMIRVYLVRGGDLPMPSWPELESFPWSPTRAALGGPGS